MGPDGAASPSLPQEPSLDIQSFLDTPSLLTAVILLLNAYCYDYSAFISLGYVTHLNSYIPSQQESHLPCAPVCVKAWHGGIIISGMSESLPSATTEHRPCAGPGHCSGEETP